MSIFKSILYDGIFIAVELFWSLIFFINSEEEYSM